MTQFSTGIPSLDAVIGGGIPPGLTIIMGPTGVGKSMLARQICRASPNSTNFELDFSQVTSIEESGTRRLLDGCPLLGIDPFNSIPETFTADSSQVNIVGRVARKLTQVALNSGASIVAVWQCARRTRTLSPLPRELAILADTILSLQRNRDGVYTATVEKCRDHVPGEVGTTAQFRLVRTVTGQTSFHEVLPALRPEDIPTVWDHIMDRV